MFLFVVQVWQE